MDWLGFGSKRIIYQEFLPGTGGDIFANLAGSCSPGTVGVGKRPHSGDQLSLTASGLNLPNKTLIAGIQHFADQYHDLPVMSNYVLTMLLASIGAESMHHVDKENQKNRYWEYFEELKKSHSVWASQHPGGTQWLNGEKSWFTIWRRAARDLNWSFTALAPRVTTYDSFSWAVRIRSQINNAKDTPEWITWNAEKLVYEFDYWQQHLPLWVTTYDHVDLIQRDQRGELYELVRTVNSDVERTGFNKFYDNYRTLRIDDWHAWEKQNSDLVRPHWERAVEQNLV